MADSPSKLPEPKFVPDSTRTSPRVYSNFATVRTQGIDFTIVFADVLPPTKEEVERAKKGQEIPVPMQCEVVIPKSMVPSLIQALEKQYGRLKQRQSKKKDMVHMDKTEPKR